MAMNKNQAEKATPDELVKEYKLSLAERNGQKGFSVNCERRIITAIQKNGIADILKARKPEIMQYLEAERQRRWDEAEKRAQTRKSEYLKTADLRRCLVCWEGEFLDISWSIETLNFNTEENRFFQAEFQLGNVIELRHVTETMRLFGQGKDRGIQYGLSGAAWEITPEQEAQLIAEQIPAAEEAEQKAKENAIAKEAEEVAQKAAYETEKASMTVTIIKKGSIPGEEGRDPYAIVEITDNTETLRFNCRNIFDVGYIINPEYAIAPGLSGGLRHKDMWQTFKENEGWIDVRLLTEFEKKALDYLVRFPPIYKEIRM